MRRWKRGKPLQNKMRRERMKDTENGGQRYIGQVEMNWGSHQGQKDIIKIVMVKSRGFFPRRLNSWNCKKTALGKRGPYFSFKRTSDMRMKACWNDNYIDTWGNFSATACHEVESVLEKKYRDGQLWQREQFLLCQERWHESAQDVYQGRNHIEGGDVQRQIWKTSVLTNKSKVTPKWYKSDESAWEIKVGIRMRAEERLERLKAKAVRVVTRAAKYS